MPFEEHKTIEISGGLVTYKRTITEMEVSLDKYLEAAVNSSPFDSGPLPQGGAFLRNVNPADPGRVMQLFAIERPAGPFCLNYRVIKRGQVGAAPNDAENMASLCLSWPRVLWIYRFQGETLDGVYLCGLSEALLESYRDQKITTILMPNVHGNGSGYFCVGNDIQLPVNQSASKRALWLHNQLQGSVWNSDLMPQYPPGCGIEHLFDWHEKTAKDPQYHRKMKFPPHNNKTVGGLFNMLLNQPATA